MRSGALVACAVVACSHPAPPPEADPAKVVDLAKQMLANTPAPGGVRTCQPAELVGTSLTQLTLLKIAKLPIADNTLHAEWINPPQLDDPAARVLADPKADASAARQAAAQLLAAPFYVVYRIDSVNAPIAVEVKELKIGTVGARAIRYDKTGRAACVAVFAWQNDKKKSDWAIEKSDRAIIDPAIAKAMRDDLAAQYLTHLPTPTGTK